LAGLAVAFVWVSIWLRFRSFEPEAPPVPRQLQAWSFLGCLEFAVDEWDSDVVPEAVGVPGLLMLVPDDFDEWGRDYETYRAWPLSSSDEPDPTTAYRWFTRADTLWVVWSEPGTSGGLALRRYGDEFTGSAGLRLDSGSANARARGWHVNCHTRLRHPARPVRR